MAKDYAAMKMNYGKSGSGKSGGPYGPGGLKAAHRNPNTHPKLNDTPCGPGAHHLGMSGDGGYYEGDTSVEHRGGTFYFK